MADIQDRRCRGRLGAIGGRGVTCGPVVRLFARSAQLRLRYPAPPPSSVPESFRASGGWYRRRKQSGPDFSKNIDGACVNLVTSRASRSKPNTFMPMATLNAFPTL